MTTLTEDSKEVKMFEPESYVFNAKVNDVVSAVFKPLKPYDVIKNPSGTVRIEGTCGCTTLMYNQHTQEIMAQVNVERIPEHLRKIGYVKTTKVNVFYKEDGVDKLHVLKIAINVQPDA